MFLLIGFVINTQMYTLLRSLSSKTLRQDEKEIKKKNSVIDYLNKYFLKERPLSKTKNKDRQTKHPTF